MCPLQTARFRHDVKFGVYAGIPGRSFPDFGLCGCSRILGVVFGALSPHLEIPFPAVGLAEDRERRPEWLDWAKVWNELAADDAFGHPLEERIANRSSDLGQPKYFLVE